MATFDYLGYDDDQITWPGGTPTNGDTITFTQPSDHTISITDNDTFLQDGTDDRDDEDTDQTVVVLDEFGNPEASGQVQPRREITLGDGTNTFKMTEIFIASSNSYYYIFQEPAPALNTEYTVTSVTTPNSTQYSSFSAQGVACFGAGTLIRTPEGDRPVDSLRIGDLVTTLDRGDQPILWIGGPHVSWIEMNRRKGLRAFRVSAGTFGPGAPFADTCFSRQHRVFLDRTMLGGHATNLDAALAPVHAFSALAGVEEITPPTGMRYYHILTHDHNILYSNGMLSETLLLTPYSRMTADAGIDGLLRRSESLMAQPMQPARPILHNAIARQIAKRWTVSGAAFDLAG
ncbi:Hint domain-containing protein [Marimonas sp. MJW-29]|uniref:Hint domain-containing protein n=1 Tax=Sulfitobacter sediminis TaxID=3234186 RepID=A0ABV3RH99_9RHOB